MRPKCIARLFTLVALASAKVLLEPDLQHDLTLSPHFPEPITPKIALNLLKRFDTPSPSSSPLPPPSTPQEPWEDPDEKTWNDAVCRGSQLLRAMTLNEEESRTLLSWPYVQSKFDGDLKLDLEKWGWDDDEQKHKKSDIHCDFKDWHELENVFEALDVDPRSAEMGGPNHCFFLIHENGKAVKRDQDGKLPRPEEQRYEVEGREYRVTGAYHRVGINPNDGIIYFLHRRSPEEGAKILWGVERPDAADLPALRASSDLTWGLWNRIAKTNLQHITMFMSISIVNEATAEVIVPRALQRAKVKADEVKAWPGTDFVFGEGDEESDDAFFALLGSPNGLAVGYFLIQHKVQLGGANFVYKITVFHGEDEDKIPNMIFYIDPGEAPLPEKIKGLAKRTEKDQQVNRLPVDRPDLWDLGSATEVRILERSEDGKHFLREHRLREKNH